jgi:hypothetical protein
MDDPLTSPLSIHQKIMGQQGEDSDMKTNEEKGKRETEQQPKFIKGHPQTTILSFFLPPRSTLINPLHSIIPHSSLYIHSSLALACGDVIHKS